MSGPGVLLDRDGTVIVDKDYLSDPNEVELIPGAGEALRKLQDAGYQLAIVSNQSGVARGYFSEDAVRAVNERMLDLLSEFGVTIPFITYCPHHPSHSGECGCRKPAPGMLAAAIDALELDPSRTWMIGDKSSDLEAGRAVGVQGILVRTGYGENVVQAGDVSGIFHICADLPEAVKQILAG